MPFKDPEQREAADKAWREANKERRAATDKAWYEANADRVRARNMIKHPEQYRKAYDPNCRPFPATLDLVSGCWVRCEQTLLRAPDTSLAAHVAAALIIIEERLAEEAA
jgi:hypothetical protein